MISVVIPTRNRPVSLARTLAALDRQQRVPDEVIVVDAGDEPLPDALRTAYPELRIAFVRAQPGVCAQRNLGIRRAAGDHILLCDDDIEPPPDYLRRLEQYLADNPAAGVVSGTLCEPGTARGFVAPSVRHVMFAFVFQLSVWADIHALRSHFLLAPLLRWYARRGNTWSTAGWPLITQVRGATVHTATYGLGAALVRRDWLLASPFDERLGAHGIGDNYGVALRFPGALPIVVLTDLFVLHHREPANRPAAADAFYQRALALDYFMRTSGRFPRSGSVWLAWSLVGKGIIAGVQGDRAMLRSIARAFRAVVRRRNPLLDEAAAAQTLRAMAAS
jgi:glycosyltransferase involved in cell wall biosynthesis